MAQENPKHNARPADATPSAVSTEVKPTLASLTHDWSEPKPKAGGYHWGTGRRKSAIARVRIRQGKGEFKINGKGIKDYFRLQRDQTTVVAPLKATDTLNRLDVFVNAKGGGTTGQVGAIVLGIARALVSASDEYQPLLRDGQYLTRDARKVERKKYGQRGARRGFQFSKR